MSAWSAQMEQEISHPSGRMKRLLESETDDGRKGTSRFVAATPFVSSNSWFPLQIAGTRWFLAVSRRHQQFDLPKSERRQADLGSS